MRFKAKRVQQGFAEFCYKVVNLRWKSWFIVDSDLYFAGIEKLGESGTCFKRACAKIKAGVVVLQLASLKIPFFTDGKGEKEEQFEQKWY